MRDRVEDAVTHFQPTPDHKRGNCAVAIYTAFDPDHPVLTGDQRALRRLARGRAPGGACGALHAAVEILRRKRPELVQQFVEHFRERAGCARCRAIRRERSIECRECVRAAAEYLDSVMPSMADAAGTAKNDKSDDHRATDSAGEQP